jgi:hypothetical protein
VKIKSLAGLKKADKCEIMLAELPQEICMTRYARDKAYKINELVRHLYQRSYEWYGFTLADNQRPELIVDIGLPKNDQNLENYVGLAADKIAEFRDSLPEAAVINGWIHSHGELEYRRFSETDTINQRTVLDYVTSLLRLPLAKVEVVIKDLVLLHGTAWSAEDLKNGSVSLVTDNPVSEARIWETEYGGFCYAIVVGDDGWHEQEIHYKKRGILSGRTFYSKIPASIRLSDDGRLLTFTEVEALKEEVRNQLAPMAYAPNKLEGL